jgi:hypothetical protein
MKHPPGDPVPTISEAHATGEIGDLYADIRATLGVPVVNLIWRHLAILPGGLAWAWQAVRPLYATGTIAAEAADLRGALDLPDLPGLPPAVLDVLGLGAADQSAIRTVLDSYDRSNAMNMVALSTLLLRLDRVEATGGEHRVGDQSENGVAGQLPKLLDLDEMAPATMNLVEALNMLGERDAGRIMASMYRHLAHWPQFLGLFWTLIAPIEADGRLGLVIAANLSACRNRAHRLTAGLGAPAVELPAESRAAVRQAIDDFVTHPIAKMVVICALIRRAMPEPAP